MTSKKYPNFKHKMLSIKKSIKTSASRPEKTSLKKREAQQLTMYSCNIIFAEHRWIRLWQGFFVESMEKRPQRPNRNLALPPKPPETTMGI